MSMPVTRSLRTPSVLEQLESRWLMSFSSPAAELSSPVASNPVGIHRGAPDSANEPGNVSGFVWLDDDADGKIDRNEGGLFAQDVYLDADDDGALDDGERVVQTNPNGYYVFKNVDPRTYSVRHVRWETLDSSKPSSQRYRVSVTEDQAVENRNFGVYLPNPNVIDYLVAYTREARAGAGGTDQIVAEISDMITASNAAFVNSQLNVRLNLVATEVVNYNESQDGRLDRDRLRAKGEGFIREIHTLRNELGADMATLIGEDIGSGLLGISYFPNLDAGDPTSFGFNVVRRKLATSEMVFTHELGHNLGAGHAHDDGGVEPFAHGHYVKVGNNDYHTIMAYPREDVPDDTVLPVFSNPDVIYKNQPLGTADFANNARRIRQFDNIVAGYRSRDQAGQTRSQAYRFGSVDAGEIQVIRDAVGEADPVDVFRFTLDESTHVTTRLFNLKRNADLQLVRGDRVIETSRRGGTNNERIERTLSPGTYFVRVLASSGNLGTTYTMKMVADFPPIFPAVIAASHSLLGSRGDDAADEKERRSLLDELTASA